MTNQRSLAKRAGLSIQRVCPRPLAWHAWLTLVLLASASCSDDAATTTAATGGSTAAASDGSGGSNSAGSGGGSSIGGGGNSSASGGSSNVDRDASSSTDAPATTDGTAKPDAPATPTRSVGCGKANPPSGNLTIDVQGQMGKYVVSIPASYNPDTPYPVGFAFHGRGNTGPQCQTRDCLGFQSVMKDVAILVYMTSLNGVGWEHVGAPNDEREINVAFFTAVRDKINQTYCADDHRVFVAGTSSGASFTNILSCRFGDTLLAAAPVAGGASVQNCKGPIAALVIHGYKDSHVLFTEGEAERDFHLAQNHCTSTAVPPVSQIHTTVVATPETHQCASYQGCDAGFPVTWCEHSEGGYDGTTHGWPKFGGQQIWDFVKDLPGK